MLLGHEMERYIRCNTRISDRRSIKKYQHAYNKLAQFLKRTPLVDDLTDETLASLMRHLLDSGLAPRTVNDIRGCLCAVWEWRWRKGECPSGPTVRPLREPPPEPVIWTPVQLERLLWHARGLPGEICGIPAGQFWYSLHLVAYDTAERPEALWQIEWPMLVGDTLKLPARIRKWKLKPARYKLHPDTLAVLESIREPARKLIWPWPKAECSKYETYSKIVKGAGLPNGRKHGLGCMRKTVLTMLDGKGGDATEHAAHSSRALTERHYLAGSGVQPADVLPRIGAEQ